MKYPKTFGRPEAVWNKLGGEDGVDRFLRGEIVVSTPGQNILIIDRSVKPTYPNWMKEVVHQELENTGPTHLDPSKAILYLRPDQKNGGRIGGKKLHAFLKDTGLLEHCLDIRVGEELVKNPHLWPSAWNGKAVFLWKSVVLPGLGRLRVPFVIEDAGKVFVDWIWLGSDFYGSDPAALSAS